MNSTVIGDYHNPKVRFSGNGGACDVASFVSRIIIFMQHEKRKFVGNVDYLTSPGWLDGPMERKNAELPGGGPSAVVTNMALMGFDEDTKKMYLKGYYPGMKPEQILKNMAFNVDISRACKIPEPSEKELSILREKCDPQKLILS